MRESQWAAAVSVIQKKKKKERKTKPNKILKTTSSASSPSQQQQQADVLNFPCEGQRKYFSRSDVVISGLRLRLGWPRANTRRRDGGGEERREERREERGEERREERREERGERRGDGLSEPICVSLSWVAVPRSADRRRCKTAETHREEDHPWCSLQERSHRGHILGSIVWTPGREWRVNPSQLN